MKKTFVTFLAMTLPFACFAQLKVDTNGNVGVGTSGTSFLSTFSVGCNGETGVGSKFEGIGTIVKISSSEGAGYLLGAYLSTIVSFKYAKKGLYSPFLLSAKRIA